MKKSYKIADLARIARTPPRTIRFYIARGLLPAPIQAGRNAAYGEEHVAALRRIAELKRRGLTLSEIGAELGQDDAPKSLPAPAACLSFTVSDDVTVLVRSDVPPWRMNRVKKVLSEMQARLRKEMEDGPNES